MDETKLTANLPSLDIEIIRRDLDDGSGESVTIQMTARPDLHAAAGLMAPQLLMLPLLGANPFVEAWIRLVEQAWRPWTALLPPTRSE